MNWTTEADGHAAAAVRASEASLEAAVLHHHEAFGEAPEPDQLWDDPTFQGHASAAREQISSGADFDEPLMHHLGRLVERVSDTYHQSGRER